MHYIHNNANLASCKVYDPIHNTTHETLHGAILFDKHHAIDLNNLAWCNVW